MRYVKTLPKRSICTHTHTYHVHIQLYTLSTIVHSDVPSPTTSLLAVWSVAQRLCNVRKDVGTNIDQQKRQSRETQRCCRPADIASAEQSHCGCRGNDTNVSNVELCSVATTDFVSCFALGLRLLEWPCLRLLEWPCLHCGAVRCCRGNADGNVCSNTLCVERAFRHVCCHRRMNSLFSPDFNH